MLGQCVLKSVRQDFHLYRAERGLVVPGVALACFKSYLAPGACAFAESLQLDFIALEFQARFASLYA